MLRESGSHQGSCGEGRQKLDGSGHFRGISSVDLVTLGRRIRHRRRAAGLTLAALGEQVGRSQSALSLIESGQREPRLSLLRALADALGTTPADLLRAEAPTVAAPWRSSWCMRSGTRVRRLGTSRARSGTQSADGCARGPGRDAPGARSRPSPRTGPPATPEEARRANAALLADMRDRDNYFADVEAAARSVLTAVGRTGGALTQRTLIAIADDVGFTIEYAADVPASTRSITDLRNRRIYPPRPRPQRARPTQHRAPDARALRAGPSAADRTTATSCASGSRRTTSLRRC